MIITTLSQKHQTTVSIEHVKKLGLVAGMKFKQWVEGNRIILEPIPDVMTGFGAFSKPSNLEGMSLKEEEEAMEMAVSLDVVEHARVK